MSDDKFGSIAYHTGGVEQGAKDAEVAFNAARGLIGRMSQYAMCLDALRARDAEIARLRRIEAAARVAVKTGPCSDSDCCDTAIEHAAAMKALDAALGGGE